MLKNEIKSKKRRLACPKMKNFSSKRMKCGFLLAMQGNDIWIWLAVERKTKLMQDVMSKKEVNAGAEALRESLSEDCKKNRMFFTDGLAPCRKSISGGKTQNRQAKGAAKQVISRTQLDIQAKVVGI